jgi:hypothetical protein
MSLVMLRGGTGSSLEGTASGGPPAGVTPVGLVRGRSVGPLELLDPGCLPRFGSFSRRRTLPPGATSCHRESPAVGTTRPRESVGAISCLVGPPPRSPRRASYQGCARARASEDPRAHRDHRLAAVAPGGDGHEARVTGLLDGGDVAAVGPVARKRRDTGQVTGPGLMEPLDRPPSTPGSVSSSTPVPFGVLTGSRRGGRV